MNARTLRTRVAGLAAGAAALVFCGLYNPGYAALTDISPAPLATFPTSSVLPNLMFILDDSGSMARDYMPDQVNNSICKACDSSSCDLTDTTCEAGHPPFYATGFNSMYYNPQVTYKPGINYAGTSLGNASSTAANNDPYISGQGTKNLETTWTDIYWCTTSSPTGAQRADPNVCRRNGINTDIPFVYKQLSAGNDFSGGLPTTTFRQKVEVNGNPHYYTITPREHCTDATLAVCTLSDTPTTVSGTSYSVPALTRWCSSTADAASTTAVSGGSPPLCQAKVFGSYSAPRLGKITRTDIVPGPGPGTLTYGGRPNRSDCVGAPVCTYAEELQNFANWYSYYRTRMLMMKTVSGQAFEPMNELYRIGFTTINASSSAKYLAISEFNATQKQAWYAKFYAQSGSGFTPLRQALSRVGRHFAGQTNGINSFMPEDPIQYTCQQNFNLLTTDGYWNTDNETVGPVQINGTTNVGNQDALTTPPGGQIFVSRPTVTLDGAGATSTTTTPQTTLQQAICTADANVLGGNNNCNCTGTNKRIKQRTQDQTHTVVTADGVVTSDTVSTQNTTYQDITACTAPSTVTTTTPITNVEQAICTADNNVLGGSNNCNCSGTNKRIKQRTINQTRTVVVVEGVQTSDNTVTNSTTFTDATACTAPLIVTQTTPVTENVQWESSNEGTNQPSAFSAAANGSNPQTTYTCSGSGSRSVVLRRVLGYNRIVTTTDGGAPVTTYSANTSGPTFTVVSACAASNTHSAGAPVVTNGAPVTTNNGGTTLTIALSPNPTVTNGAPTVTNTGTQLVITLNPNPTVTTTGPSTTTANPGGYSNTLADVAMYYYKTDLRPTMTNNVPSTDSNFSGLMHQHMVTFTLGLGLDGLLTYDPNYPTANSGDFYNIKTGATGCSWASGTCNWPQPAADSASALDDLWHAAVNGRGRYFSAKDPNAVAAGIATALASITTVTGAAASSATSTPNITLTDNFIYSSTYRTVNWDGKVVAQEINTGTGEIIPTEVWDARALLQTQVAPATDTRLIYTFDGSGATKVKPFAYGSLTPAEQAFFTNKCIVTDLPQCSTLSVVQIAAANDGTNLVNWLRGQLQHEGTLYRDREWVLGDTVNARPVFVGPPSLSYGDGVSPDYATFKAAQAGRQKMLYIAANDGMLHAINATTGQEMWAYVPRMVMPNLYRLAASDYSVHHRYFVDGSPAVMDVRIGSEWKTILVGGLNAGGRGFYALDITNPDPNVSGGGPKGLWEICSDATLCAISDDKMGLSFADAIITKLPGSGTWAVVVSSGHNNVTPGDGKGYLYVLDAATGAILSKVTTGAGDATTPSGFAKIRGFADDFAVDNTTTFVYGGDLLGNIWRFDMSTTPPTAQRLGQLRDAGNKPQSVTTNPEITKFTAGFKVLYFATGRFLGGSDMQDPATLVPAQNFAYQQSVYALKDTGLDLGDLRLPGAQLVQQTLTVIDQTSRTTSTNAVDWSTQNGWYMDFNPGGDSPGERVNIDPQLVRGVLVLVTNEPTPDVCVSGGFARLYQLSYNAGTFIEGAPGNVVSTVIGSALAAGFVIYHIPSGQLKVTEISITGDPTTLGVNPGGSGAPGQRTAWRELLR